MSTINSKTALLGAMMTALCLTSAAPLHAQELPDEGHIEMTAAQRQANGVETARAERRKLPAQATVPGEVTMDLYRSAQITPRIAAQVVERKARLGDRVKAGQPVVTLSSVDMAEAQGAVIVATREWERVRELGRDVVSERRYVESQVAADLARARVLAYGLTPAQADALARTQDAARAAGLFDLLAPRDGVILSDDFMAGEVVQPGRVLFQMTDGDRLWVRAQLSPGQAAHVSVGTPARILTGDGSEIAGTVVQIYQMLDETTRTLPVRIEVTGAGKALRPGQFVSVAVTTGAGGEVLAVPAAAVILLDGGPAVFRLAGDAFTPTPIETGETRSGWTVVEAGLASGDEVAASNVFLLKSLIQKSDMGEGHAH
jgi:cobalt-zinc-cadmium efflux system membrane fusion protein